MIRNKDIIYICFILLTLGPSPLQANDLANEFRTPSGNIRCSYIPAMEFEDGSANEASVDCYIVNFKSSFKRPLTPDTKMQGDAKCTPKWMSGFNIGETSKVGKVFCPTDYMGLVGQPVIEYGHSWSKNGFKCQSDEVGIECHNHLGHGYFISRNKQQVF